MSWLRETWAAMPFVYAIFLTTGVGGVVLFIVMTVLGMLRKES